MIERLLAVAGLSEPEAEGEDSCSPATICPSATTPAGTEGRTLVQGGGGERRGRAENDYVTHTLLYH